MRRVVHLRGPDFDHGRFSPASKGCFEDVFPLEDVFFSFEVQVTLDLVHGYYELREGLESTGGPPEFDFLLTPRIACAKIADGSQERLEVSSSVTSFKTRGEHVVREIIGWEVT